MDRYINESWAEGKCADSWLFGFPGVFKVDFVTSWPLWLTIQ